MQCFVQQNKRIGGKRSSLGPLQSLSSVFVPCCRYFIRSTWDLRILQRTGADKVFADLIIEDFEEEHEADQIKMIYGRKEYSARYEKT